MTPRLFLVPGDAPTPAPGARRPTPSRRGVVLPGTTAFRPNVGDDAAELIAERIAAAQAQRAEAIDAIRAEVDAHRADDVAWARRRAAQIYRRSPARRARWLADRIANAHRVADRLLADRLAFLDRVPECTTGKAPGAYWGATHDNRATGSLIDGAGVARVTLTVTGDEAWQAAALRALRALADDAPKSVPPIHLHRP